MPSRRVWWSVCVLVFLGTTAHGAVRTFDDKTAFLTATGASSASGSLPDVGTVAGGITVGTITFSLAPGGNTLSIGASGTGAAPDWYPALPGNDIALGFEHLQVQTAAPVFAFGFDFVEPDSTMPPYGGTPVDSTYEVVLYAGTTEVGRFSFNALDDAVGFVGVWSDTAFDRVTIIDTTGDDDDEYFGEFYTGTLACRGDAGCTIAQASQCTAKKLTASGTYMEATLDCHAQAVKKGQAVAGTCLQRAEGDLTSTYAALEGAGACKTTGDTQAIAATADAAVTDIVASLGGPGPSRCTQQKLNAAGKAFDSQQHCYAKAVAKGAGHAVERACLRQAEQQLLAAFTHAEATGDCVGGTGDAPVIDKQIGAVVRGIRARLSRPHTTCAPVEVTRVHGDGFLGHARLAKIKNGKVGCMHKEEGTLATCAFSTAPGSESGAWLESPEGTFALVGQGVSRQGQPGGEHVVVAPVSDAAPAPCLEPTSMDTMGLIAAGEELIKICVVEDMLEEWNALSAYGWFPLINWANREVCSNNNPGTRPHPDNAFLVRSFPQPGSVEDDTFCYTGRGAALNDINGTERDEQGMYLLFDEAYCHYLWQSGYEVPAAKRPATRSLPAPGSIVTSTFIVWRPVNPNINIANEGE